MKNFFDCKNEKITEKAFTNTLLVSIISILLCVVALCSITYAWFTTESTSESNVLSSGSFDVVISVVNSNGEEIPLVDDSNEPGNYYCTLPKGGVYTVTLKMTDESTVKGHCLVKIGSQEYNTEAILNSTTENCEGRTPTDPLVFTVDLTSATEDTKLVLSPRWGEVVEPTIFKGGTYPSTSSNVGEENN